MKKIKIGRSSKGKSMHYSVGAIIKRNNKYLMMDRKQKPYGFACLAGHVDQGETPEKSVVREVKEESNLKVISYKLLLEDEQNFGVCPSGGKSHYWYVYSCKVKGKVKQDTKEQKSIAWLTKEQIKQLNKKHKLEPAWKRIFKKLEMIP